MSRISFPESAKRAGGSMRSAGSSVSGQESPDGLTVLVSVAVVLHLRAEGGG